MDVLMKGQPAVVYTTLDYLIRIGQDYINRTEGYREGDVQFGLPVNVLEALKGDGINLIRDLGYDEATEEVRNARAETE